jgi:hypothetical protein
MQPPLTFVESSAEIDMERQGFRQRSQAHAGADTLMRFGQVLFFLLASISICVAQPKSEIKITPPLNVAEAEKEGRALVADLLAQRPEDNTTNRGVMTLRRPDVKPVEIQIRFEIFRGPNGWTSVYEAAPPGGAPVKLTVHHSGDQPSRYLLSEGTNATAKPLSGNQTMAPFAGSDFWAGDLGLEFFHWPQQRVLRKQIRLEQACNVLESVNPHPAPGAYSRVESWVAIDSGALVHAEAYDSKNECFKVFVPKKLKKINGQYQLDRMEISNLQTRSRTRIDFNL